MGVPVLTVPGRGFAARVCASLVQAAGLPDFVCATPEEYVRRAIAFGRDRAPLAEARARLLAGRATAALFDTPGLVRALEDLFRAMWSDFVADRLPCPDLGNLDTYHALGAALDESDRETGFRPDWEARWQHALARRDAFAPLPPDRRLWAGRVGG
jgi:hypothetical protein